MEDEEKGVWRTVGGRRIFIADGQTLSEAMAKSGKFGKTASKSYSDWSSEDKKRFRRWYRKHAEALAKSNPDKDEAELRKMAQEQWGKDNIREDSKLETKSLEKSVSERLKEQRAKQELEKETKPYKEHTLEELKAGKFDDESKKLVLEDGTEIGLLDKKTYKSLCEQQLNQASEATKEIVNSYTETQATAGSAYLNAITEEKLKNHNGGILRYHVAMKEGLLCTQREFDEYKEKAYQDWKKSFAQGDDINYSRDYEALRQWREKWKLGYSAHPSDYDHENRMKDSLWTKEEVAEAKAIYPELKKLETERSLLSDRYDYGTPEFEEGEARYKTERAALIDAIESPRLRVENRSAYWYNSIAKYDETLRYRPDLDIDEEIKKGNIKRMNTKEIADLDYNDNLKSLQPTDVNMSISGLKSSMSQFDEAFEKDGIVLDRDILVFRRGHETWDEINGKEGFTKYGYISTSAQDTLPKKMPSGVKFGEQSYYIHVPKGTKVLFAEDIIGYNTSPTKTDRVRANNSLKRQHEIILPRNCHFDKIGYSHGNGAYILKVEVNKNGE